MFYFLFMFIIFNVKSPKCSIFVGKKFKYVEIRKSHITGGGYGVYATQFIKNGTRLEEYDGDWYTLDEFDRLQNNGSLGKKDAQYSWKWTILPNYQDFIVNAKSKYAKWPTCVNDNYNTKFKENIDVLPAMSSEYIPTLWYDASRDIHKGEELFVSYGEGYWATNWSNPKWSWSPEKEEENVHPGIIYWTSAGNFILRSLRLRVL